MENFIVTLEFLAGLTLLFAFGYLIGYILKLDRFYADKKEENTENNLKNN